jgi:hypothetical protein
VCNHHSPLPWKAYAQRVTIVIVAMAYAGFASAYHRSTWPARFTYAFPALIFLVLLVTVPRQRRQQAAAWFFCGTRGGREPHWPSPALSKRELLITVAPWIAIFVIVVTWEILALLTPPHQNHLTISALSQAYRPFHALLFLVWLSSGAGYLVI